MRRYSIHLEVRTRAIRRLEIRDFAAEGTTSMSPVGDPFRTNSDRRN